MAKLSKRKKAVNASVSTMAAMANNMVENDISATNTSSAIGQLLEAREDISIMSGKYRTKLNETLARVFAVADRLRTDRDQWQDFCRDPAWIGFKGKTPRIEDQSETLKYAIRFAVGFEGSASSKMASKYCAALEEPFRTGVPANDIPGYIEANGGIEKLATVGAARRRNHAEQIDGMQIIFTQSALTQELLHISCGATVKAKFEIRAADGLSRIEADLHKIKTVRTS